MFLFSFESQLPVEGKRRVFEFLESGGAVLGPEVLVPLFCHGMFVIQCGPFGGFSRGVAGEVSDCRCHVVEKSFFAFRGRRCAGVLAIFFIAHSPRKVPPRVFVDLKLCEEVIFVGVVGSFVVVYLFCECPPESGLPVLMSKVV